MIREYLLGRLTEAECEALEDQFFGDSELMNRIDAAERALIQEYLGQRLSAEDRAAFESHFLRSTAARRKVEESRTVAEYFRRSARRRIVPRMALAATVLLLAAVTTYLAMDRRRTRTEMAARREPRLTATVRFAEFEVTPGRNRSSGSDPAFVLQGEQPLLRLRLKMDPAACGQHTCRAEILKPGEPVLLSLPVLEDGRGLYLEAPSSALPEQADLLLDVRKGRDKIESFQFGLRKISLSPSTR